MNALMQMAIEYGRSGDGEGLRAVEDEIAQLRRQMASGNRSRGYQPFYSLPRYGPQGAPPVFLSPGQLYGAGGGQRPVPQVAYYGGDGYAERQGPNPATVARLQREEAEKQARIAKRRGTIPGNRIFTPPAFTPPHMLDPSQRIYA
jgi:hypothetical protein